MEERSDGVNWLLWLIVVPAALAAGALIARVLLHKAPAPAVRAAPVEQAAPAPAVAEKTGAAAAEQAPAPESFVLPGDEPDQGEASVSWGKTPSSAPAASAAANPAEEKKSFGLGLAYGALTKAAGALLRDPKAMAALFNNDYVVKGFMSRDTVKRATATKASLAAYMKDPANLSKFMAKEPVRKGMNDSGLVNAVFSSKLAGAMLDTPGGKALLNDPAAISDVIRSNPGILEVLMNPVAMQALVSNPKTAGLAAQIAASGGKR